MSKTHSSSHFSLECALIYAYNGRMQAQSTQIRVTLPVQLQGLLQAKTSKFGLSLSAYIKNLIINDVQDVEIPVFQASKRVEKSYKKALQERDAAIPVPDVNVFFDNL